MSNKVLISWEAPEYIPKVRSNDWFWAVGIISSAIIITSVLLNNVLLAIFFLIATVAIFIHAKKNPVMINVDVTEDGIKIGNFMHPYSMLKSFYIDENDIVPFLMLQSNSVINSIIKIPMEERDIEDVNQILSGYLKGEKIEEPLSQKLMEYLGF